jgi:hypothetical protein
MFQYEGMSVDTDNGCPIVTSYNNKWYVIGMQIGKNQKNKSHLGLKFTKDILELFMWWTN